MAKIKTREIDKTTVKTKNQSIFPYQKIRNAGSEIRRAGNKEADASEQSVSEYSTARVEEVMGASTRKGGSIASQGINKGADIIREKHRMSKAATMHITNIKKKTAIAITLKEKLEDGAKTVFFGTKALIASIAGGGTVAIVVIIICCFLGSIVYFSDGENLDGYKPIMVAIAEDEIGNEGGEKYWRWYGFEERVEWCAIFVSWCAEQCGYLDAEVVPKFSAVDEGSEWFKEKNQWASNDYVPKAGDIIFFDWESDGLLDHVGIVAGCKDDIVYTVEGNSEDVCRQKQYAQDSNVIAGYGVTFCYNLEKKGVE